MAFHRTLGGERGSLTLDRDSTWGAIVLDDAIEPVAVSEPAQESTIDATPAAMLRARRVRARR